MDMNFEQVYNALYAHYGELHWWPAKTPYEMMVGAVLTQNTAWINVERAIANYGDDLSPECVANMDMDALKDIIRPAGFFNQKAVYIKALTAWLEKYQYDIEIAAQLPLSYLREELLSVRGIGRETADSILLYALSKPSFVVDKYTRRWMRRMGIEFRDDYETIKAMFEGALPRDIQLYNNYHALIVAHSKAHCRAKPSCTACPLHDMCGKYLS